MEERTSRVREWSANKRFTGFPVSTAGRRSVTKVSIYIHPTSAADKQTDFWIEITLS